MGIGILARPLLASVFVLGGYNQLKDPGGRPKAVEAALAHSPLKVNSETAELLTKANGAVMLGAGCTMALGILPRLSALALISAVVPTTIVGHPFWSTSDEKLRSIHQTQVAKNAGLVGGLLLVAATRRRARKAVASEA